MANSLLDLGTTPVFPLSPNWARTPTTGVALRRRVVAHPGTAQEIVALTAYTPMDFSAGYTLLTKADENTLLTFFCARRGRCQRFWVQHHRRAFTLKTAASSGATTLYCSINDSEMLFQGLERIYIRMSTGDILTRQVNSVILNTPQSRVEVSINSGLDRDLTTTNHIMIGRLLLVRFDNDELSIDFKTDRIAELELNFSELVQEYALA